MIEHLKTRDCMKVLIGCEFSQIVTQTFRKRGHDAYSCDLLPTEGNPAWHFREDIFDCIKRGWDLAIFHPPCTYLTVSGNKWMKPEYRDRFPDRPRQRKEAIDFFMALANADIPRIAIENPIGIMSTVYRRPDQIIQPWMFGHPETKATCLWLTNLPKLVPTNIVSLPIEESKRMRLHYLPRTPDRWKERSRTFVGVAEAFSTQWNDG